MNWFGKSRDGLGREKSNWRWALCRAEKRAAHRLIEWLIKRYKWHGNVLDANIPNVRSLRAKKIVMVNGYGQERTWEAHPLRELLEPL